MLGGAAAAALAGAVPAWEAGPAWGATPARGASGARAAGRDPRVVIIGSGIAGLGCAYRLWASAGIRSDVYEYNASQAGGRLFTLRGFFDGGQYAEQHAEFISSEHTEVRRLAAGFGLRLDNVGAYPPHTRAQAYRFRFDGSFWPQAARERRHLLLPVLHAVQDQIGWISPGALNYLCRRLDVPPAEAYGVASFYALCSTTPQPPTVIHVCDDIACKTRGADAICASLEERFGPAGHLAPGTEAAARRAISAVPSVLSSTRMMLHGPR